MKKLLTTTTAAILAGVLAMSGTAMAKSKPIKVKVGGYMETWIGVTDNEEGSDHLANDYSNWDVKTDSEVHVKGSTTHDNGVKYGFKIEIETSGTDGGGAIDESEMYASGAFGKLNLGSGEVASEGLHFAAPENGIGLNKNDHSDWVIMPTGHVQSTSTSMDLGMDDDANITYYSPRVNGFQIGLSYAPEDNTDADALNLLSAMDHTGIFAGLNFNKKLGGSTVKASFGWGQVESADDSGDPNKDGWSVGFGLKYGNVNFGFSFLDEEDKQGAGQADASVQVFNIGVVYTLGGGSSVGAGYWSSAAESAKTTAGDDETEGYQVAFKHVLGKGVDVKLAFIMTDYDGENNTITTDDNDGHAVVLGLDLQF